ILVNSADPIFVVQVRAGGQTRLPNESYDLPEIHMLAAMQLWCKARQVTINRHDTGTVLELDDVAVSALFACKAHSPFASGAHRRAHWRGIVDAFMRANPVEDRVAARGVEPRTDARELNRRTDECLAQ